MAIGDRVGLPSHPVMEDPLHVLHDEDSRLPRRLPPTFLIQRTSGWNEGKVTESALRGRALEATTAVPLSPLAVDIGSTY